MVDVVVVDEVPTAGPPCEELVLVVVEDVVDVVVLLVLVLVVLVVVVVELVEVVEVVVVDVDAAYTKVTICDAIAPLPPQVALTVNVPLVHRAFPPG